jgi:hypothetical protein
MGLFRRWQRASGSATTAWWARALSALPQRLRGALAGWDAAQWRALVESGLVALGGLALSVLFVWAAVTDRVGVESIVVILVLLILTLFAVGQGMYYYRRTLALQACARESARTAACASEIMMEFLRDFTLKNQEVISRLGEAEKARVVDELGKAVEDLIKTAQDADWRRELLHLKEAMAQKVMAIPTGVAFPLPRLEWFDRALSQMVEPERAPACPACGAARARVTRVDGRDGIQYRCVQCGHEFSLGIAVMLEKQA